MSDLIRTAESTGLTAEQGFGTQSMSRTAEMQTAALTAKATASVQARYIMAVQRPRNWDNVRVLIMKECARPRFAAAARYRKPIGAGVEGPSIRFAEACLRFAGNMDVQVATIFEDRVKRILQVTASDFETNASFGTEVTIDKTVERSSTKGRMVLGERTNSGGGTVFVVEATEDELLNKQNAMISKAARTLILRLIPADIVEDGQDRCIQVVREQIDKDPSGERKRVIDLFAEVGVMPAALAAYIGHELGTLLPAELAVLRRVYSAIKDNETTWKEVIGADAEAPAEGQEKPKKATFADRVKRATETAKEKKAKAPAAAGSEPKATDAKADAPTPEGPKSEPRRPASDEADPPPPDDYPSGNADEGP